MVLRLGGMGFLVSFIGCFASLMAESGLVDIMSCDFYVDITNYDTISRKKTEYLGCNEYQDP